MSVTLLSLVREAASELGIAEGSFSTDGYTIVNKAAREMMGAHHWNWAVRALTHTMLAESDELLVPDMHELIGIVGPRSSVRMFELGSLSDILAIRNTLEGYDASLVRVTRIEKVNADGGMDPYLWFSQAIAINTVFTIHYRARWVEVQDDRGYLPIPWYCENLLSAYVRAFARGIEESDDTPLEALLANVRQSSTFAEAQREDARTIRSFGPIRNGAARRYSGEGTYIPFRPTFSPPSV